MAKSLTVRELPVEVVDELSARAARSGRSLQEYVRGHLIELVSRPDPQEWVAQVRARKAATGGAAVDSLLADVAADRR